MHNVNRPFSCALLITMLVLVFTVIFGVVHASTTVIGILESDAKWTVSDSPHPIRASNPTTLTSTQAPSPTELYIIIGVIVLVTIAWIIYIFYLYRKRSSDTPV